MNQYKIFVDKSETNFREIAQLFMECGWGTKYSQQSSNEILSGSNLVVFVKDRTGKLVGLLRILSEGSYSSNVMDIVTHPRHSSDLITTKMINTLKKQFRGRKIHIQELNESNNYFFINRGFKLRSAQQPQVQMPWFAKLFSSY